MTRCKEGAIIVRMQPCARGNGGGFSGLVAKGEGLLQGERTHVRGDVTPRPGGTEGIRVKYLLGHSRVDLGLGACKYQTFPLT